MTNDYNADKLILWFGDCLERMKEIPSGSVDMVLTDPPYGSTDCKWDSIIPLEPMWEQLKRVIKPNGAIVLFGSEPFSSALRMSNIKNYKYDWIWEKEQGVNFQLCKYQPLKIHETISVFSMKTHNYYPQGLVEINKKKSNSGKGGNLGHHFSEKKRKEYAQKYSNYPKSIQNFTRERGLHPTQKPVALMEYLIKTYTDEGDTVLDFTMGSGTTGVACVNLNRRFIGIENDPDMFPKAVDRILKAVARILKASVQKALSHV